MKILNIVFKLILTLVILAGIAVTILITMVNPNKYKPIIQTQLSEAIGRPITIRGDLDWQFFPSLAINAHQVYIGNPPGFTETNFAEVEALALKVNAKRLLKREIVIPEITIKTALINLEVNSSLVNNWSDFAKSKEVKTEKATQGFQVTGINVDRVNISDTVVNFRHQGTQQLVKISHLNIKSNAIQIGQAFPISLKFTFKSTAPGQNKTVQFSGDANINGQLSVDVPVWNRTHTLIPAMTFKGQVDMRQAQFDKLHVGELSSTMVINSSMVTINPVHAQLYGGKADGAIIANMQQASPRYELQANFAKISASQFFRDLVNSDRITGTANATLSLNSSGKSVVDMTRTLNGKAKVAFTNGELVGVDIPFLVDASIAAINKKEVTKKEKSGTPFKTISGNMTFSNGEITNPDFYFDSDQYNASGSGTVNLNSHQVNYRLKAKVLQVDTNSLLGKIQKALGGEFPLIVSGTWDNIKAQPDMPALVAARTKVFLQEGIKNILPLPTSTTDGEQPAVTDKKVKPADKAKTILKNLLFQ